MVFGTYTIVTGDYKPTYCITGGPHIVVESEYGLYYTYLMIYPH